MRLSELQSKKIISMNDGKQIGVITDVVIDTNGKIESLIIESTKSLFSLARDMDSKVYWNEITKIGEDVILVKKDY